MKGSIITSEVGELFFFLAEELLLLLPVLLPPPPRGEVAANARILHPSLAPCLTMLSSTTFLLVARKKPAGLLLMVTWYPKDSSGHKPLQINSFPKAPSKWLSLISISTSILPCGAHIQTHTRGKRWMSRHMQNERKCVCVCVHTQVYPQVTHAARQKCTHKKTTSPRASKRSLPCPRRRHDVQS